MLSYLHSFHAGNFADVLKHLISSEILHYLTQKPKPVFYLDTHSGAGAYELQRTEAQKNKEFENGIGALWQAKDLPPAVAHYIALVNTFNQQMGVTEGQLHYYPGSPWFAQQLLREQDRLALFELHPREHKTLLQNTRGDRRIKVHEGDGYQGCKSQLPPKEKRGYILMDPPYEVKQDYQTVVETLKLGHKKFATGTYALWYPVVERQRIHQMEKAFVDSGIRNIQIFELGLEADNSGRGMTASGMLVINPPWTLKATMDDCLPYLAQTLGGHNGIYRSEQLVAE